MLDTTLNMSDIAGKVDPSRVGLLGFSFGGYLGGRACSYMGDRLRCHPVGGWLCVRLHVCGGWAARQRAAAAAACGEATTHTHPHTCGAFCVTVSDAALMLAALPAHPMLACPPAAPAC